jgi:DNA polymerase-4
VGRRAGHVREAPRARDHHVGQVAALQEGLLISLVGRAAGRHLHALAHNRDPRAVRRGVRRRSMGSQRALGRRRRQFAALDEIVVGLVDRIARRLRRAGRTCRTITLRLRFDDFSRATRSHTLTEATTETLTILAIARALLAAARR